MSISDVFNPLYFDSVFKPQTKANLKNEFLKSDQIIQTNRKSINIPKINIPKKRTSTKRSITKTIKSCDTKTKNEGEVDHIDDHRDRVDKLDNLQNVIFLDWDDTLMPTSYLLSFIDYEIEENEQTKRKIIKTFTINEHCNEAESAEFILNLSKAGNASYQLLLKILSKFKPENIKIITNGVNGWLIESLKVAGSFCKIYKQIYDLIFNKYSIDIYYARDYNLKQDQWKTKCFDQLLWQYFNGENCEEQDIPNINIITIGDQWTDHESIAQSLTYSIYGEYFKHHTIKLFANPDCRYLCVELNYISDLLDQEIFFKFDTFIQSNPIPQTQQGLVLEFDGYN